MRIRMELATVSGLIKHRWNRTQLQIFIIHFPSSEIECSMRFDGQLIRVSGKM